MNIRERARDWIQKLVKGTVFDCLASYDFILNHTADGEEKWKKDPRWFPPGLKAKRDGYNICGDSAR